MHSLQQRCDACDDGCITSLASVVRVEVGQLERHRYAQCAVHKLLRTDHKTRRSNRSGGSRLHDKTHSPTNKSSSASECAKAVLPAPGAPCSKTTTGAVRTEATARAAASARS